MLSSFAIGERHIPIKEKDRRLVWILMGVRCLRQTTVPMLQLENYGTMTLLDTSEAKNCRIAGENRCVNNYGTMTIDGGKYSTSNTLEWRGNSKQSRNSYHDDK